MKQTHFFAQLLRESWHITWNNKVWWFWGFLSVFLSGSLGYQLITSNVYRLAQPNDWVMRWRWLSQFNPGVLIKGQWHILMTDPKGWVALIIGWLAVLLVVAVLFVVSVFAVDLVLSGLKLRQGGALPLVPAIMETKHHLKPLALAILAVYAVSNLLLLACSIPVTAATLGPVGLSQTLTYVASFLALFLFSVLLAILAVYTWLAIVFNDYRFKHAVKHAWQFLRDHWIATISLLILQIVILMVATLLLLLAVALVLIPIVIATYFLVAYKQFDLTMYVPRLVFYGLIVVFTIFSAAFTIFQLSSWALLYQRPNESDDQDMMS